MSNCFLLKVLHDVVENSNEWIVKIEDESVSKDVFDYVKTLSNIRKFEVEEGHFQKSLLRK